MGTENLASRYASSEKYKGSITTASGTTFVYMNEIDDIINDLKKNNPTKEVYYEFLFSKTSDFKKLESSIVDTRSFAIYKLKLANATKYYMLMNIYLDDGADRTIAKSFKGDFENPKEINLEIISFTKESITINATVPSGVIVNDLIGLSFSISENEFDFNDNKEFTLPKPFDKKYPGGEKTFSLKEIDLIPNKQYYVTVRRFAPVAGYTHLSKIIPVKFCE